MKRYSNYINGQSVAPQTGTYFDTLDPYLAKPWAHIPDSGPADVDQAVQAAHHALHKGAWPAMNATQRGALLRKLGDLIAQHADALGRIEVQDNGKLLSEMGMQLRYIPQWYYYYGGLADKIEGQVIPIDKPDTFNFTRHEPIGVVAMITPWNSPLLLLAYKLAPALAAGCTVVIKPSEFTSASTLELAQLVHEAGFPPGVVNVVTGNGAQAGAALVNHPLIAKISFTGSDATGQKIYEQAARNMSRVTLELGGKSPNIVFDDANLDNAANGVVSGIFAAGGQTCIAGSRLLVQRRVHDALIERIKNVASSVRMGNPLSPDTQMGPIANEPQLAKIMSYMDVARADGAELLMGGKRGEGAECGNGWFVEPTIYVGVNNNMRIAREEVFGPVLAVIPFDDEDEAVAIANDTPYGLAAGVWTTDMGRSLRMSAKLQAGTVWVNTYRAISYLSPFGGYKRSGIGRENGQEAIHAYLQTKSVWISTAGEVPNPFIMR